jgi:GNAT superfamily N-acetyltransferase
MPRHTQQPDEQPQTRIRVRPYRPHDLQAVRRICGDTGFLGKPIDPIFEDRELFADYLTGYYTRFEADALLVCEVEGEVRGYLMGCRLPLLKQSYQFLANIVVASKALYRCFSRPYNQASRAFLIWVLMNSWREVPVTPRNTPHFHMNVLPDARSVRSTRVLIRTFLDFLRARGCSAVYGQMVTYSGRRTVSLFKRYGFRVLDRVEVTKYRSIHRGRVLLCTVVKDLRVAAWNRPQGAYLSNRLPTNRASCRAPLLGEHYGATDVTRDTSLRREHTLWPGESESEYYRGVRLRLSRDALEEGRHAWSLPDRQPTTRPYRGTVEAIAYF